MLIEKLAKDVAAASQKKLRAMAKKLFKSSKQPGLTDLERKVIVGILKLIKRKIK